MIWRLFITFFKIGGFTIGGGYVMIPLIEREVVRNHGWVDEEDFLDLIAVAQSAPGIIAVNSALVVGYKVAGLGGAFMAALGAVLPSFLMMLLIANFYLVFRRLEPVAAFMAGAAPVVVALLFYAAGSMGKKTFKDRKGFVLGGIAFLMSLALGLNPIILIILGGLLGYLLYHREERKGESH